MKSRVYQFHGLNYCRVWGNIYTRSYIKKYINTFFVIGIATTSVQADNEFDKSRELIRRVHFEMAARGKHVGDI